jgi:DNA-binding GntR family transcriptional regulator
MSSDDHPTHSLDLLLRPERPRLADRAYSELRTHLIEGKLPPGTRLIEQTLTSVLGISRTPLREALWRLEQDGLVERRDGGGLYVTELTQDEFDELMGMRAVVEGFCARLAAERLTDAELAEIAAAHEDANLAHERNDLERLAEAGTHFHDAINAASRSPRCIAMVNELRQWAVRYRPQGLVDNANRRWSSDQHAEILAALRARDGERAEHLVRLHLDEVGTRIRAAIQPQAPLTIESAASSGHSRGTPDLDRDSRAHRLGRAG